MRIVKSTSPAVILCLKCKNNQQRKLDENEGEDDGNEDEKFVFPFKRRRTTSSRTRCRRSAASTARAPC